MSSRFCRLVLLAVLSAALLCNSFTLGGPAHSFALVAARASKIPRSIRAPFRNTEMMTARGFGKRSQPNKFKDNEGLAWNLGKNVGEAKFYNDMITDGDNNQIDEVFNESPTESFPLDWLANEMSQNTALAQAILHRFVDANQNGIITTHELMANPLASNSNNPNRASSSSDASDVYGN